MPAPYLKWAMRWPHSNCFLFMMGLSGEPDWVETLDVRFYDIAKVLEIGLIESGDLKPWDNCYERYFSDAVEDADAEVVT